MIGFLYIIIDYSPILRLPLKPTVIPIVGLDFDGIRKKFTGRFTLPEVKVFPKANTKLVVIFYFPFFESLSVNSSSSL